MEPTFLYEASFSLPNGLEGYYKTELVRFLF